MTDDGLAKDLQINRRTLTRWRGMPGFPKKETAGAIRKWRGGQKRRAPAKLKAKIKKDPPPPVRERKTEPRQFIVTTRELAGLTGKSKPTIDNWVNSNGMPIEGRSPAGNTFDLARALPWLLGYYNERIEIAREEKRGSSEAVRRTRADANLKELELAKRRGELVDVQEAVAKMAAAAANFTGAFRGKPVDWAQAVEGKAPDAISRYLDGELARIFGELQNTPLPENIPAEAVEHFRAALAAITEPITEKEKGQ